MKYSHQCAVCLKPYQGKARQRFCSARCRLLHWAARELLKTYREGCARGLGPIIAELREER